MGDWITSREAANLLGYDEFELAPLYKLLQTGQIEAEMDSSGKQPRWRIRASAVLAWQEGQTGPGRHDWRRNPDWRHINHNDGTWTCRKCHRRTRQPASERRPCPDEPRDRVEALGLSYSAH